MRTHTHTQTHSAEHSANQIIIEKFLPKHFRHFSSDFVYEITESILLFMLFLFLFQFNSINQHLASMLSLRLKYPKPLSVHQKMPLPRAHLLGIVFSLICKRMRYSIGDEVGSAHFRGHWIWNLCEQAVSFHKEKKKSTNWNQIYRLICVCVILFSDRDPMQLTINMSPCRWHLSIYSFVGRATRWSSTNSK